MSGRIFLQNIRLRGIAYLTAPTYWATEACPTMGCSIEISRDMCMSVCLKETHTKICMSKMRGRNYVAQKPACSKSVWGGGGGVNRPVTLVLFISTTVYARAALAWMKKKPNKNVHLEMRNLKQTELQRQKNRGKKEDREEGEPKKLQEENKKSSESQDH